jgi:outer membrane receptor for Fe3+-dicitrate
MFRRFWLWLTDRKNKKGILTRFKIRKYPDNPSSEVEYTVSYKIEDTHQGTEVNMHIDPEPTKMIHNEIMGMIVNKAEHTIIRAISMSLVDKDGYGPYVSDWKSAVRGSLHYQFKQKKYQDRYAAMIEEDK